MRLGLDRQTDKQIDWLILLKLLQYTQFETVVSQET